MIKFYQSSKELPTASQIQVIIGGSLRKIEIIIFEKLNAVVSKINTARKKDL